MVMGLVKKLLGAEPAGTSAAQHQERIAVATCALLLEMAHTDGEFHAMEQTLVQDILKHRFDLSEEAAAELIDYAQQERDEHLDLYHFARQINTTFSIEEKLEVLEALWRVVYADGALDKYEEYLMRQLSKLLRLSHRQMIESKLKVLGEIEV